MRGSAEAIAQWRRQPVGHGAECMPASFLKHADDQTVLALTTVLETIRQQGWQDRSFTNWGVLAAPNLFGRVSIAQTIQRFQAEGAWGVSPHLIPHQSLHAISGTISQALKIHGPNFGIGGGPNAGLDAFLLAPAMLPDLPGLWLVLSGYESEWIPSPDAATPAPVCQGVALALTNESCVDTGMYLTITQTQPDEPAPTFYPEFQLSAFAKELATGAGKWRLADSLLLELEAEARP